MSDVLLHPSFAIINCFEFILLGFPVKKLYLWQVMIIFPQVIL